jgi:predicted transcriptional regulator YdeE
MSMTNLVIKTLPAMRGIGLAMMAKAGVSDFAGLWRVKLAARAKEIEGKKGGVAMGVCRCVAGSTDGTFEYIALIEATETAKVPPGMVEVKVPACDYAAFGVSRYAELGEAWHKAPAALAAQTEWKPYCDKEGCRCGEFPSFEFYPSPDGTAAVYIAVHR